MQPDYEAASAKAKEVIEKYPVSSIVDAPLEVLKSMPGVLVLSYEEASSKINMDRTNLLCIHNNHKAITYVDVSEGRPKYVVVYNQKVPFEEVRKSLARELGHIVLGHNGSLPEDIRTEEAICFADKYLEELSTRSDVNAKG